MGPRLIRREEKLSPAQTKDKRPHIPHSQSPGDLTDYTSAGRLLEGLKGRGRHLIVSDAATRRSLC